MIREDSVWPEIALQEGGVRSGGNVRIERWKQASAREKYDDDYKKK